MENLAVAIESESSLALQISANNSLLFKLASNQGFYIAFFGPYVAKLDAKF